MFRNHSRNLRIVLVWIPTSYRVSGCGSIHFFVLHFILQWANLNKGEVFLVKDLFKGYVWNRIPRKDRLLLGTLFLNYANKMEGNIKAIEKTSSNQQRYQQVWGYSKTIMKGNKKLEIILGCMGGCFA